MKNPVDFLNVGKFTMLFTVADNNFMIARVPFEIGCGGFGDNVTL